MRRPTRANTGIGHRSNPRERQASAHPRSAFYASVVVAAGRYSDSGVTGPHHRCGTALESHQLPRLTSRARRPDLHDAQSIGLALKPFDPCCPSEVGQRDRMGIGARGSYSPDNECSSRPKLTGAVGPSWKQNNDRLRSDPLSASHLICYANTSPNNSRIETHDRASAVSL